MIPFLDLNQINKLHLPAIEEATLRVLRSGWYILGNELSCFEKAFAQYCRAKYCVGVANGLDAITLILKAYGFPEGSEIIVPANTYIASVLPINMLHLFPVFVEPDVHSMLLNPSKIEEKITPRTKAILTVDLYGRSCEMDAIRKLAKKYDLKVITDAAQAHGALYKGQKTGSIADATAFSFYPTKNLGAYGDAGCLITNNSSLAEKVRRLANHGGLTKDEHLFEGTNSRLDTLQAAILNIKLKHLSAWNKKRNMNANLYFENLSNVREINLPKMREGVIHTFHQFVIRAKKRNELKAFLVQHDVDTVIHYPKALPFEPAYKYLNHNDKDFPISVALQEEVLSLPVQPELNKEQILYVCGLIKSFYETR